LSGQAYSYTAAATDNVGDGLVWALESGPDGMTFDANGVFEWTPDNTQFGPSSVTIRVTDGANNSVTQTWTINTEFRGADALGYTWAPVEEGNFNWRDVSGTQLEGLTADGTSEALEIGFEFSYYGNIYI
jgi:hypothetical protein